MPEIVELKQDRNLMYPNFDGYKLSLDRIPVFRQDVLCAPLKAESNEEQYSMLHAELFSTQNLLVVDPWARTQSYFVNCLGEIVRCAYDENTVCDGVKTLSLLETGNRLKPVEWTLVAICAVEGDGVSHDEKNYVIFDARLDIIRERKQISVVLGHVQHDANPSQGVSNHLYLHCITWTLQDSGWKFQIVDTLRGSSWVYYCAFEPRSDSVVISSSRDFKWKSDISEVNMSQKKTQEEIPKLHGKSSEENEILDISWSQTEEDLILNLEVIDAKDKRDYDVTTLINKIEIKCKNKVLLEYELFDEIDKDLTTWTINNNFLQITLIKNSSGLLWTSLLANGSGPKETNAKITGSGLPFEQQPIPNLDAPVEDCDFPMGTDNEISISRFNLSTKTVTHTIIMGSTPPLFSTSLRPGFPPALATREDVDCCLWLQQYNPSKPGKWYMRHEGNLPAFGYVQASKQQKKFIDCSPDLGYAVIAELHRHIFLYNTKYDSASGLRNRNGAQITIGKQHLITLEDAGEILGLTTANNVSTLLTEKCIYFLKVGS